MAPTHWTIEYGPEFQKGWKNLDSSLKKRVISFLSNKLHAQADPKTLAKPLTGNLKSFWRYRLGDYRLVCDINDKKQIITLMRIAHRREVYKKLHLVKPSL